MKNLVIVESPTKARTLTKFLGSNYQIEASMGHIRDLPKSDFGIDIENNFEPKYVIPRDKTKRVNELKKLAMSAQKLWLATDPDREGEAIAWHIKELLVGRDSSGRKTKNDQRKTINDIQRVTFHEITPEAVKEAFEHPREINSQLVDAQQARRVLDRLVGYKLSPLLWKKVKSGLSAGRVQSVALRLIVEREEEIGKFKPVEYWSVEADLEARDSLTRETEKRETKFRATLVELNDKKLEIHNQEESDRHLEFLKVADYQIRKINKKEVKKYPYPPFTTSTLQQTASNRLGMTAKKTMMLAQYLYEHGLITYMRTDSVNLSAQAITQARDYIGSNIGKLYLPSSPRVFKTKSKLAQEAHEAIRPTNPASTPEQIKSEGLTRDHIRLYELIWNRLIASQMSEAVMDQTSVDILATRNSLTGETSNEQRATSYTFRATGSIVKFDGWMKLFGQSHKAKVKSQDEEKDPEQDTEEEMILPRLDEGEALNLLQLLPQQHFTEPPPRFNEGSLIKKLEELGIGRPSTYAPIISTIQDRYYVERKERKFFPTELGKAVNTFLMKYFKELFDYSFTAKMEDEFDEIASGHREWKPTIAEFYNPLAKKILETESSAEKVQIQTEVVDKNCPLCGKPLTVRFGRFGKFLACSGFPECKHTESLEEAIDAKCPDCGGDILLRKTRKGRPFYGCKNWPTCKFASWTKPTAPKKSNEDETQKPASAT